MIGDETLYNSDAKHGGMDVREVKRMKRLQDENARPKRLLTDAMRYNAAMQELVKKVGRRPRRGKRSRIWWHGRGMGEHRA